MEYFNSFSPKTREQAIRCLTAMFPDDAKKFKRMKYNELYAKYKKSHLRMYNITHNPMQGREMKVSHASQTAKALCRTKVSTSAVGRGTTATCIGQTLIQKGR